MRRCPTDQWLPADHGRRLAEAIPNSKLLLVQGAGHLVGAFPTDRTSAPISDPHNGFPTSCYAAFISGSGSQSAQKGSRRPTGTRPDGEQPGRKGND